MDNETEFTRTDLEYAFRSLIKVAMESFDSDKKQEILDRFIEILEKIQDEE